jgi:hypothetical protein
VPNFPDAHSPLGQKRDAQTTVINRQQLDAVAQAAAQRPFREAAIGEAEFRRIDRDLLGENIVSRIAA